MPTEEATPMPRAIGQDQPTAMVVARKSATDGAASVGGRVRAVRMPSLATDAESRMIRPRARVAGSVLLGLAMTAPAWAEPPTLAEVVNRTVEAVAAWQEQLSNVVAEELYTQRILDQRGRTKQ